MLRQWIAGLLIGCALALGCANQTVVPDEEAPVACFTMRLSGWDSTFCALSMDFGLDVVCTSDNATKQEHLQVRWDFQNNGLWDTPYENWTPYEIAHVPDPSWSAWKVRMGVRDLAGNEAEYADSMSLSFLPQEPDLVMGRIFLSPGTVVAGKPFWVWTTHSCFEGLAGRQSYTVTIYIDGVKIGERDEPCDKNWSECSTFGVDDAMVDTAGQHEVSVVLDVDDRIPETDETNNTLTIEITAVD